MGRSPSRRERKTAHRVQEKLKNNAGSDTETMNTHIIPTPHEIDAVIFDMIAAEAARVPDDTSLDELWSSVALDSAGEFRGYSFGHTPAEARAGAWITVLVAGLRTTSMASQEITTKKHSGGRASQRQPSAVKFCTRRRGSLLDSSPCRPTSIAARNAGRSLSAQKASPSTKQWYRSVPNAEARRCPLCRAMCTW